jgi:hypothetical protein
MPATTPYAPSHVRSSLAWGALAVLVALVAAVALLSTPPLRRETSAGALAPARQTAPPSPPVPTTARDTSVPEARIVFEGRDMAVEDAAPTF